MNPEYEDDLAELRELLEELRPMLRLDPMDLEEECRRQPEKFDAVGEVASHAKALSRKAKDRLSFVESDLRYKIRKDPDKYNVPKGSRGGVTEGAVSEVVEIQDELREAKSDYIELSRLSEDFSTLVSSMEQRKAMLRDLVSLYTHKYYSNQSLLGEEKSLNKRFEEDVAEERAKEMEEEE